MRERVEEPAGRRIPHVHAAAEAGRGQPPAVRAERQRDGDGELSGKVRAARPPVRRPRASRFPPAPRRQAAARRD